MKRHGHARVDPRSPRAFAICDRCGQLYNHDDLRWQIDWRGRNLQNLRLLVCDTCLDVPQEQLRVIVLPPDPLPIPNARPELADIGSTHQPDTITYRLAGASGSFGITGHTSPLPRSIQFPLPSIIRRSFSNAYSQRFGPHFIRPLASYGITGHDNNLSLFPSSFAGPFSNGFSNGFGIAGSFIVNTGAYALSGHAAVLKRSIKSALDSGSYGITGQNANLVLTTGGPSAIFSVNWVTTSSIPAEMTFARGSVGTYWNSSGVLASASTGVARFEYSPVTLVHQGLLVEASATNYVFSSDSLNDGTQWGYDTGAGGGITGWTAPDGTAGQTVNPNGTSGASLGSTHSHHGLSSGATYTTSVHAKAVTGRYQWLSQTESTGARGLSAVFDLAGTSDTVATQTLTWGTGVTVSRTAAKYLGNNVWRLSIIWSMTLGGDSVYSNMGAADAGTGNTLIAGWSRVASTNSNIAGFWGEQLEAGNVATSYIYTSTAAVTRSADIVSSTDAGLLAAKGWVVEVGELPTATALTLLGVNTIVALGVDSTAHLTTADGGVQTTTATGTWGGQNRGGIAWDTASRVSISLNGGTVTTAANTRTAPTTLYFGNTNNGASGFINGHIRVVKAYTALTDLQLPTVSTVGA